MWHSVFLKIRMESSPLVQSTLISLCIYSLHRGTVTAAKFPVRVSSYRLVQAPVVLGTAWGCFCLLMTFILSFPFGSMTAPQCLMGNVLTGPSFHAMSVSEHCTVSTSACSGASSSQGSRSLAGQGSKRVPKCNSLVLQEETGSG